jgi:hypothetical protein
VHPIKLTGLARHADDFLRSNRAVGAPSLVVYHFESKNGALGKHAVSSPKGINERKALKSRSKNKVALQG